MPGRTEWALLPPRPLIAAHRAVAMSDHGRALHGLTDERTDLEQAIERCGYET